eukprot:gene60318-80437_t
MYRALTGAIEVTVVPRYLPDQSEPGDSHFVWSYTVKITNHGTEAVQLRSRYWHITDEHGVTQEVRGAGVVLVRQRPGSANGVIFMTLEDETGIANVVVWPAVMEKFRKE